METLNRTHSLAVLSLTLKVHSSFVTRSPNHTGQWAYTYTGSEMVSMCTKQVSRDISDSIIT